MTNAEITFRTDLDNSQLVKDLREAERQIRKAEKSIAENESAKSPFVKQAETLSAKLKMAQAELGGLEEGLRKFEGFGSNGEYIPEETLQKITSWKDAIAESIKSQHEEVTRLQGEWDSVNKIIAGYDTKIEQANAAIASNTELAQSIGDQLSSGGLAMQEAFDKAEASAQKLGNRLKSLAARAMIFNVISSGLRSIISYMGDALQCNDEYSAQLLTRDRSSISLTAMV